MARKRHRLEDYEELVRRNRKRKERIKTELAKKRWPSAKPISGDEKVLYRYPSGLVAERTFRARKQLLEKANRFLVDNEQKLKAMDLDVELQAARDVLEGFAEPEMYTLKKEGRRVYNKSYNLLWSYIELLKNAVKKGKATDALKDAIIKKQMELEKTAKELRRAQGDAQGARSDIEIIREKHRQELDEMRRRLLDEINGLERQIQKLPKKDKAIEALKDSVIRKQMELEKAIERFEFAESQTRIGKRLDRLQREDYEKKIEALKDAVIGKQMELERALQRAQRTPAAQLPNASGPARGAAGGQTQGSRTTKAKKSTMGKILDKIFSQPGGKPESDEEVKAVFGIIAIAIIILIIVILLNIIF